MQYCHFNRMDKHILLAEEPASMKQSLSEGAFNVKIQSKVSYETTAAITTAEPKGTAIDLK